MRFSETAMERTVRVRAEWKHFCKTRDMSALEFETKFIKLTAQLERAGMPITDKEKHMCYLEKVGHPHSEMIRMDRRQRSDRSGGSTERLAETWEEAHAVLVEVEAIKAGTRMLLDPNNNVSASQERAGWRSEPNAGRSQGPPACNQMRDHGKCSYGDKCRFNHDPKVIAGAKKTAGKLCKFIRDPSLGECPNGKRCPFAHDPERVKRKEAPESGRQYECEQCEARFKTKEECQRHEKECSSMAGTIAPSDDWDSPVGLNRAYGMTSVVIGQKDSVDQRALVACLEPSTARGRKDSSQSDLELPGPGVSGWRAKAQGAADVVQLKVELATVTASAAQLVDELKAIKNEVAELRSALAIRNKESKKKVVLQSRATCLEPSADAEVVLQSRATCLEPSADADGQKPKRKVVPQSRATCLEPSAGADGQKPAETQVETKNISFPAEIPDTDLCEPALVRMRGEWELCEGLLQPVLRPEPWFKVASRQKRRNLRRKENRQMSRSHRLEGDCIGNGFWT
jgi:hypothetical protein